MMLKWNILVFFIGSYLCNGQQGISGYTNLDESNQSSEVYLSQLVTKKNSLVDSLVVVAKRPIDENGFFSFDKDFFPEQSQRYQLGQERKRKLTENRIEKSLVQFRSLIHAKKDTTIFQLSEHPFGYYSTTSSADRERQRLQDFESRLEYTEAAVDLEQYLLQTRGFIKDSLQILLVKLIGIKKLEEKQLLHKDIRVHRDYYRALLVQLQDSDLTPTTYAPFEKAVLHVEKIALEQKYDVSLGLNILGLLLILALGVVLLKFQKRNDKPLIIALSKQENKIKSLILEGKSNKEIANELFISISTVKTHISNIYSKLHVSSRKELLMK